MYSFRRFINLGFKVNFLLFSSSDIVIEGESRTSVKDGWACES